MNDTEMLDWINEHLASFRHSMRDAGQNPMIMEWIGTDGNTYTTVGENIRHCINNSVKEQPNALL